MKLWNVPTIQAGLDLLASKGTGTIVVKDGNKGAVVKMDGKIVTIPAFSVNPIHTIGAGDSFDAGFIAAQRRGDDLLKSVTYACATAALKISQEVLPTPSAVTKFIAKQASV
jgi:sugar/nucleoside kinase (ribokinase family)